jgi:hypothetical protein
MTKGREKHGLLSVTEIEPKFATAADYVIYIKGYGLHIPVPLGANDVEIREYHE